eukprot:TRINITY_DN57186_c0_g1_i1.p1 TRINITY_DN57186_c0_g1~~TRINITY_DN57186_c0_g1_i1.p1  ORF type:complete len:574 (-),score=81.30 TRINITY_DN57186_c0_g1_i1:110-1786(-)
MVATVKAAVLLARGIHIARNSSTLETRLWPTEVVVDETGDIPQDFGENETYTTVWQKVNFPSEKRLRSSSESKPPIAFAVMPSRAFRAYMDGEAKVASRLLWLRYGIGIAAMQNFAPDHLCTLLSLSSITTPVNSIKLGGAWGFTHSFGTILIFAALQAVRSYAVVNTDALEDRGNYIVALLLVGTALYFIISEDRILILDDDGNISASSCACHGCLFTTNLAKVDKKLAAEFGRVRADSGISVKGDINSLTSPVQVKQNPVPVDVPALDLDVPPSPVPPSPPVPTEDHDRVRRKQSTAPVNDLTTPPALPVHDTHAADVEQTSLPADILGANSAVPPPPVPADGQGRVRRKKSGAPVNDGITPPALPVQDTNAADVEQIPLPADILATNSDVPPPPVPPPPPPVFTEGHDRVRRKKNRAPPKATFYKSQGCQDENCPDIDCVQSAVAIHEPRRGDTMAWLYFGGFLGFLQGLLCPTALASINLLVHLHSWTVTCLFFATYIVSSVVISALMTYCWALLAGTCQGVASPVIMYRGSCYAMLGFGAIWFVAATSGILSD